MPKHRSKSFFCHDSQLITFLLCPLQDIFSTAEFDKILRSSRVYFGKNLDVTSYSDEEGRETHNPVGRAHPPVVWDFYNNGCSLRMINPQVGGWCKRIVGEITHVYVCSRLSATVSGRSAPRCRTSSDQWSAPTSTLLRLGLR